MLPRPLRSTLFPYTTLFRSCCSKCVASRFFGYDVTTSARHDPDGRPPALPLQKTSQRHSHRERRTTRRSEEHTSELQSRQYLVCRLLLEKKKKKQKSKTINI